MEGDLLNLANIDDLLTDDDRHLLAMQTEMESRFAGEHYGEDMEEDDDEQEDEDLDTCFRNGKGDVFSRENEDLERNSNQAGNYVNNTAFREAEEDLDARIVEGNIIDQCMEMVQKSMGELYSTKLAETETKYIKTIDKLNAQVEELESKLASLEYQDKNLELEEVLRQEYEAKFSKLEQDMMEKFKLETEDLVLKIESEMEGLLITRGITAERRKELEQEVKEEIKSNLDKNNRFQSIQYASLPPAPEPLVKIVYQTAPKDKEKMNLELAAKDKEVTDEMDKLNKEHAQVSRLKSLWHVRVKKAGEVLKALDKEREDFKIEKEKFYKEKARRSNSAVRNNTRQIQRPKKSDSLTVPDEIEQSKVNSDIRTNDPASHADNLESAFRQMIQNDDHELSANQHQYSSRNMTDRYATSENISTVKTVSQPKDNRPTGRFVAEIEDNDSVHNLPQLDKPRDNNEINQQEDINDFVQRKLWGYRESAKKRIEEVRSSQDLDLEIKKIPKSSKVNISIAVKEQLARQNIQQKTSPSAGDSTIQYERSFPLGSEFDFSYHPVQHEKRTDHPQKSGGLITFPRERQYSIPSPQITPISNKRIILDTDAMANEVIKTLNKAAGFTKSTMENRSHIDTQAEKTKTSNERDQMYQVDRAGNRGIFEKFNQNMDRKGPSFDCLMRANQALGINNLKPDLAPVARSTHKPSEIDIPSMINMVFFSSAPYLDDSRSLALLDLYRQTTINSQPSADRLAVTIARHSRRGVAGVDRLADVWRECLADYSGLAKMMDTIEDMSAEQATERIAIELKFWGRFKEKYAEYIKKLKRRETVRGQISSISLEFCKLRDIEMFNQATAGCYNVLRAIDKSLLKCPKEITYKGIKVDTLIKLDLFEEEYLHKVQSKIALREKFKD